MPEETNAMVIAVPYLELGDSSSREKLAAVFAKSPCVTLGQAWRANRESEFKGAWVRLGWKANHLVIWVELQDADIFNRATKLNEKVWLLGDTFEMFLQRGDQPSYGEFHVTPENQRFQMLFLLEGEKRTERLLDDADLLHTCTWVDSAANTWWIYAEIPAATLGGVSGGLSGETWKYSFSRYDYTKGLEAPVLSSSSPHVELNFHRRHEWLSLTFLPRPRSSHP